MNKFKNCTDLSLTGKPMSNQKIVGNKDFHRLFDTAPYHRLVSLL